ncbi:MAG: xanthine dehydrogenase family protein molybdopterin-binding subunit, partial [Sphingobacteriales bacterium]
ELGQGIRTAIAQVAAEELDLHMNQVQVKLAETGVTPDEGYTAGSGSIENSAMSVRFAAAAARAKLLQLAAAKLQVNEKDLTMEAGTIRSQNGKKQISFAGLLNGQQITDKVTLPVILKNRNNYKLVGKPVHRSDITDMVKGKPAFVQDLRFPGMVHARILRPINYGASLEHFDEAGLKTQFPFLLKTVVDGSFVGVIAENEYSVVQIQTAGQSFLRWKNDAPLLPQTTEPLNRYLRSLPMKDENVKTAGNPSFADNAGVHAASYSRPYTMHGSIGPSCSVALYAEGMLHIWSHSQGIYPLRISISKLLDIPLDKIHITGVPGAGCYGHNGADDVSAEAAILAIQYPGKHVRLQWSREDEHAWEPYGSAMIMDVRAKLGANNMITDWQYDLWSDTHGTRPGGNPENLLPARHIRNASKKRPSGYSGGSYRNSQPYYNIPNQKIDMHFFTGPLRVSALRSLGAFGNIFAIECFMDELAIAAKVDPYEFRLMHLTDPRAKAVLVKLREMVNRSASPKPDNNLRRGTGIAFSRYKNTAAYCAVAVTAVYNDDTKQTGIEKMFSVIDAGEAINTDGIINQTEGGMIQAASWTMQEEVKFDKEAIRSLDWKSYPIFRFSQSPETEVEVINNPAGGPLGAGEAAQGPAGAAVANAIYYATGVRYRDLPITRIPLP